MQVNEHTERENPEGDEKLDALGVETAYPEYRGSRASVPQSDLRNFLMK
jgi:hypothetical protein